MFSKDAMRAQYYLRAWRSSQKYLKKHFEKLKSLWPTINEDAILEDFSLQLADQLDQMLLPVIAYEITKTKSKGMLRGNTPRERYDSFFIQDGHWTRMARFLSRMYPFLFEMIETLLLSSTNNLCDCLNRLEQDLPLIRQNLLYNDDTPLLNIHILNSDRHRGGKQALALTFESEKKIIFKPTDVMPDQLFAKFIESLKLKYPYDLRPMRVLPKDTYGWLEYIPHTECPTFKALRNYYRRAGVLLAIADALNYCDGHMDNLIACGAYPVLIDCETLFHNFGRVDPELGERSILFTGLVEKPPENDSGRGFTAALQTPGIGRLEFLHPYALNDHTDNIAVKFHGISREVSYNCPRFKNQFQTPHNFVEEFIEGFAVAYDYLTSQSQQIIKNSNWWTSVSKVRARQLVRHTLYYQLLVRKVQQPEGCKSRDAATRILRPLLSSKEKSLQALIDYELADLLKLDIPYFYHYPGSCNLYDGSNKCYPKYFQNSAIEEIRQQFTERSNSYRERSIAILRNILPASPIPY